MRIVARWDCYGTTMVTSGAREGCDLCEAACPSHCIKVISSEDKSLPLQRYASDSSSTLPNASSVAIAWKRARSMRWRWRKMYEYSTQTSGHCYSTKSNIDIGERHLDDAKKYLYAHGQKRKGRRVGNTGTFSRSR